MFDTLRPLEAKAERHVLRKARTEKQVLQNLPGASRQDEKRLLERLMASFRNASSRRFDGNPVFPQALNHVVDDVVGQVLGGVNSGIKQFVVAPRHHAGHRD